MTDNEKDVLIFQLRERIALLNAQAPKVVIPEMKRHLSGAYWLCSCGVALDRVARYNFCPYCGAKLDWSKE